MIPCLVMGDSLAVGVAQFRPECRAVAEIGITSERYLRTLLDKTDAQTVVISLGVNDGDGIDTIQNLQELRGKVHARTVYWLLPGIKEQVRREIRQVAAQFGDRLIDTRPQAGPDHLHPTGPGYQYLASLTERDGAGVSSLAPAVITSGTARSVLVRPIMSMHSLTPYRLSPKAQPLPLPPPIPVYHPTGTASPRLQQANR